MTVSPGSLDRLAHARGALVAVDNTLLSPYFQRPLMEVGVEESEEEDAEEARVL